MINLDSYSQMFIYSGHLALKYVSFDCNMIKRDVVLVGNWNILRHVFELFQLMSISYLA